MPQFRVRTAAWVLVLVTAGVLPAARMTSASQATTLTGCVRAGSASGVFLLRGATTVGALGGANPEDYLLVGDLDKTDFTSRVNHRMAISGVVSQPNEPPAPPAGANAAERALKRLSVRDSREVAPACGDSR